jgi:anti-anti-sigma factor
MTKMHSPAPSGDAVLRMPWKYHATRLNTRWLTSSVVIVSAYGDIDGTNADTLTEYAVANAVRCRGLILDLSGLEFFGTDGFSVLHRVSVSCARGGIGWALVSGATVSRLLRICDPHGWLPALDNLGAAMASLHELLQLRQEQLESVHAAGCAVPLARRAAAHNHITTTAHAHTIQKAI